MKWIKIVKCLGLAPTNKLSDDCIDRGLVQKMKREKSTILN
jgi:hypothetical protein